VDDDQRLRWEVEQSCGGPYIRSPMHGGRRQRQVVLEEFGLMPIVYAHTIAACVVDCSCDESIGGSVDDDDRVVVPRTEA
jgi:hypothetical protein